MRGCHGISVKRRFVIPVDMLLANEDDDFCLYSHSVALHVLHEDAGPVGPFELISHNR